LTEDTTMQSHNTAKCRVQKEQSLSESGNLTDCKCKQILHFTNESQTGL